MMVGCWVSCHGAASQPATLPLPLHIHTIPPPCLPPHHTTALLRPRTYHYHHTTATCHLGYHTHTPDFTLHTPHRPTAHHHAHAHRRLPAMGYYHTPASCCLTPARHTSLPAPPHTAFPHTCTATAHTPPSAPPAAEATTWLHTPARTHVRTHAATACATTAAHAPHAHARAPPPAAHWDCLPP